jgi:hypothetical protein
MKFVLLFLVLLDYCYGASKSALHPHNGVLLPYSGRHLGYEISLDENIKLEEGEPVRMLMVSIFI